LTGCIVVMRKLRSVDLLAVSGSKKIELVLKIRRQMQQKALEEKLTRSLLSGNVDQCYPEAIGLGIEDLLRKALEELKQNR
jgi:hypothetical protein